MSLLFLNAGRPKRPIKKREVNKDRKMKYKTL